MKKTFLLLLVFVCFSGTVLASFPDVREDGSYTSAINWLQENGVVQGYEDGTFRPNNPVNRAEFLKMLYGIIGMERDDAIMEYKSGNPFSDVPNDEWYTKYVLEAYAGGVVSGYSDGTFKPENTINFAEAFKIVQGSFFKEWYPDVTWQYSYKYDPCYKDLGASNWDKWYWGFIQFLDNYCIIPENVAAHGKEFDASLDVTRGDMAELLYRAKVVRDNSEYWDYSTVFSKYTVDMVPGEVGFFGEPTNLPMEVSSPDFSGNFGMIPQKYTCDGEDINPSLTIEHVPEGTKSFVLIMEDKGAPSGVWTHWLLWNINPDITEIAENSIPEGAVEGLNSWGEVGYRGPCPSSEVHEYEFKIYALDTKLDLDSSTASSDLLEALGSHWLDYDWVGGHYPSE